MSRARNLADLLDANGDVASGALDNVPPSNDASALTTGTLPVERVPYVGRRNLIINGAMQVWQRGTVKQSDAGYIVDRFKGYSTDSGVSNYAVKATRQQDSALGLKGYCAEISLTNTSGGINYVTFGTRIEASSFHGVNSGDKMTFSFYLKRMQAADSSMTVYVKSALNGVDSYQSAAMLSAYDTTVSSSGLGAFNGLSTSWTRYTFTFTVTDALITNGGQIFIENGNADLNVTNTNALYRTTGWQLEVGSVATPFEHRSYGEELALCQRYYEKSYNIETVPGANDSIGVHRHGGGAMDNDMFTTVKFAVTKRATPTMTAYTNDGVSGSWKYRRNGVSATNAVVSFVGTGQQGTVPYLNVGTSYVVADMYGHWVASAEL